MKSRDQLLMAGELGRAAFHAGNPCSPAKDKDFKRFLMSCGDRRVGASPPGEATTLALLDAWITQWRQQEKTQAAARPPSEVPQAVDPAAILTRPPQATPVFHSQPQRLDAALLQQGGAP